MAIVIIAAQFHRSCADSEHSLCRYNTFKSRVDPEEGFG